MNYYKLIRHDGNKELFKAVEMSIAAIANDHSFHVHAQGLRGTGKTSIMRSVKDILPPIVRIKNCIYNCHPEKPHCPQHRGLCAQDIQAIGIEKVPRPFLEISHAAKIGTVVGSIDLSKLTNKTNPMAALMPGTIPKANRGIIFIDEINRLADTSPEIADILLDLMGTKPGRVQIEETGLPTVELPVTTAIWAASNPDEDPGPLVQIRKQLADRFDIVINMGRPTDYQAVTAILKQRHISDHTAVKDNPLFLYGNLSDVVVDDAIRNMVAAIYIDFGLESIRAVESMETAAGLAAMLSGRRHVTVEDIAGVVPLVLANRADASTIGNILKYLAQQNTNSIQSLPAMPRQAKPSITELEDRVENMVVPWWKKMWRSFQNKLQVNSRSGNNMTDAKNLKDGNKAKGRQGKLASSQTNPPLDASFNAENAAVKAGGTNALVDPSKIDITAPPQKAVPLSSLSIDNFVSSEDK